MQVRAKDWASALLKILRHTAPEDPERAIFIVPRGNEPGRASRVTGSWPGEIYVAGLGRNTYGTINIY